MRQSWRKPHLAQPSSREASAQSPLKRSRRSSTAMRGLHQVRAPAVAARGFQRGLAPGSDSDRAAPSPGAPSLAQCRAVGPTQVLRSETHAACELVLIREPNISLPNSQSDPKVPRGIILDVNSFQRWCMETGFEDMFENKPSSAYVDIAMEKSMEILYKSKRPMTEARGALFGWAWSNPSVVLRQMRHLPLASKALAGWSSREPGGSRQPWPWLVTEWLTYEACIAGMPLVALVLLLSFDCYFRLASAKLRHSNFVAPQKVAGAARQSG